MQTPPSGNTTINPNQTAGTGCHHQKLWHSTGHWVWLGLTSFPSVQLVWCSGLYLWPKQCWKQWGLSWGQTIKAFSGFPTEAAQEFGREKPGQLTLSDHRCSAIKTEARNRKGECLESLCLPKQSLHLRKSCFLNFTLPVLFPVPLGWKGAACQG